MLLRWFPAAFGSLPGAAFEYFVARNYALAMAMNELSHKFFARAVGVNIRCVNEVSTCLAVGLIDFLALRPSVIPIPNPRRRS